MYVKILCRENKQGEKFQDEKWKGSDMNLHQMKTAAHTNQMKIKINFVCLEANSFTPFCCYLGGFFNGRQPGIQM